MTWTECGVVRLCHEYNVYDECINMNIWCEVVGWVSGWDITGLGRYLLIVMYGYAKCKIVCRICWRIEEYNAVERLYVERKLCFYMCATRTSTYLINSINYGRYNACPANYALHPRLGWRKMYIVFISRLASNQLCSVTTWCVGYEFWAAWGLNIIFYIKYPITVRRNADVLHVAFKFYTLCWENNCLWFIKLLTSY